VRRRIPFRLVVVILMGAGAAGSLYGPVPGAAGKEPDLVAKALALGCEEIVFAERAPGKDGHWYANFGYAATASRYLYGGQGGFLHRLNLRTGKRTVILGDATDPIDPYAVDRDYWQSLWWKPKAN